MPTKSINHTAYNLVAEHYAEEHTGLVWQEELNTFIGYVTLPSLVIDLGCGPGDETAYLAERLPNAEVIGVDFAEHMIRLARQKDTNAQFVVGDMTRYRPRAGKLVQGLWARASFHHLNEHELHAVFEQIVAFRDDGMVIGMINKFGETEEIERKQKYGTLLERYFNYMSPKKVKALADEFGYEVIEQYMKPEGGHQFLVSYLRGAASEDL